MTLQAEEQTASYYEEDNKTSVRNQYMAAIIVGLSTFCYGADIGWISPSLRYLQGPSSPLHPPLTSEQGGSVASLYCVGALFGTLVFGLVSQRLGRRKGALIVAVPYTICWILKLTVNSLAGLYTARILAGIGGGGALLIAPLYCLEVGATRIRGALGSVTVVMLNIGVFCAYTVGAFFSYYSVLWMHFAVPLVFLVTFFFMPETPTYLVKTGKYEEAAKAIAWLRNISPTDPVTLGVLSNLKQEDALASRDPNPMASVDLSENTERQYKSGNVSGWKLFITSKATLRAFVICVVLVTIQGYVGIFAVMNFASDIFADAGSSLDPDICAIILSVLQTTGSYFSLMLVERLGRKLLFAISSGVLGICLAILGTYLYFKAQGHDLSSLGWLPVFALSFGICIDAMGVGPVPFVIINEVFMVQARGIAVTCLVSLMWVSEFIQTEFYVAWINSVGSSGVFWGFSAVAILGAVFTLVMVPETKGIPLDEILQKFDPTLANNSNKTNVPSVISDSDENEIKKY